jgi:hypothetical protein
MFHFLLPPIIKGQVKTKEPRAKSQEPRAKSQKPKAKSQKPKAKSQKPKALPLHRTLFRYNNLCLFSPTSKPHWR